MSKTSRKKQHRLTGRVRRMLKKTDGRMMIDVIPDSEDISERLRREDNKEIWENDSQMVRQVATDILESHRETMHDIIDEETRPIIRRLSPYALRRGTPIARANGIPD